MTDSSSSSTIHTNVPDVGSTRMDNVPVQVTTIQLNKENYLRWSAAITVGIAGRGRIAYVNGRKVEPVEGSIAWDTWYLEDNQVKMWIINYVSSKIQPLILRKKTARDMWVILEHMYDQKKRKVRVYQLMRDVYSLRQGSHSVAEFYAALKSKWEDLDYHSDLTWKCPQDQMQYMTKEWENRVFLFLSGLNDDYENIRSQILNSDESFSIEDVYARVEAEEQRKLVSNDRRGEEQSAFLSRASDLHPEKKNSKGRPSASKQRDSSVTGPSDRKGSFSAEQLRELRAYLSQADGETPHIQVLDKDKEDISAEAHELGKKEEEMEKDVPPMVTEQEDSIGGTCAAVSFSLMEKADAARDGCLTQLMVEHQVLEMTAIRRDLLLIVEMTLSPKFAVAKAQMLTGVEIPDLVEAYNRLSRLAVTLSPSSAGAPSSALAIPRGGGRGRFHCTFYGRLGHLEDRCLSKHGRPMMRDSESSQIKGSARFPKVSHVEDDTLKKSVSISKSEYEQFLAQKGSSSTLASTVVGDSAFSTTMQNQDPGLADWEDDWWRP
ncbi:hypothetical protein EJ110_NYTH56414 [Nymphaea thermarum]|nr:hypothetical protein EJ110_NYTH56414 [Nymphaea thermarum]